MDDVIAGDANHQAPAAGFETKGRALFLRSCDSTTRIATTNGSRGAILSPSRRNSLQPGGPAWVPRCWCGPMAASMQSTMD